MSSIVVLLCMMQSLAFITGAPPRQLKIFILLAEYRPAKSYIQTYV